jgi:hypothetical protein
MADSPWCLWPVRETNSTAGYKELHHPSLRTLFGHRNTDRQYVTVRHTDSAPGFQSEGVRLKLQPRHGYPEEVFCLIFSYSY